MPDFAVTHTLPPLPYRKNALEPHISEETVTFHYERHHQGYITMLNNLAGQDPEMAIKSLEELVRVGKGPLLTNACQVYNHNLYWNSISPNGGGQPFGAVKQLIERDFGTFDKFKTEFTTACTGHFGSGWIFLVLEIISSNTSSNSSKGAASFNLKIHQEHDAGCPLTLNQNQNNSTQTQLIPILCCDVWEHAYYIDHRNNRGKYLECFFKLINWEFANKQLGFYGLNG